MFYDDIESQISYLVFTISSSQSRLFYANNNEVNSQYTIHTRLILDYHHSDVGFSALAMLSFIESII